MNSLTGAQKRYLRGLAHGLKPVVLIGQKHLTPRVIDEIRQALAHHELIKVKCIDQKEKAEKKEIAQAIIQRTGGDLVGMIGHILILYKQQDNPEKRKIILSIPAPSKQADPSPASSADSVQ